MKHQQLQFLLGRGLRLALTLLSFAAIPLAAFAQADAPATPDAKAEISDDVAKEIAVAIEGKIKGGGFIFEGDSIRFVNRWGYPSGVTVNGTSWEDLRSPFKLGFTPDFAGAALQEKEGELSFRFAARETMVSLTLNPAVADFRRRSADDIEEVPFRVKLAMKKQDPSKVARPATTRPTGRRPMTNQPPEGVTDFESLAAMMRASAAHRDDPTDGTPHPRISMGTGLDTSFVPTGRVPKGRERVKLTISAVVDKEARFEIIKNKIYYRPFQSNTLGGANGVSKLGSLEGNYPSKVSVNGKAWPNLRKPLDLDFTPDLESLNGISMSNGDISFSCFYSGEPGNLSYSSRLVLEIRNKGAKPSPSEIELNTTALPNKDVKDPDDFEHNPFVLRAVVDDEATFIFGRGEIRFVPGNGKRPTNVSVDGTSWDNLRRPFELRKLLANPDILEMKGRGTAELTRQEPVSDTYLYRPGDDDEFKLVITDKYAYPSADLYEIKIDSRKAPPVKNKYSTFMAGDSEPKDPADFEAGRFILAGTFYGPANFICEGNEIRYLHQAIGYPSNVTINGNPWPDLKKPFRLDASPLGMKNPDLLEVSGPNAVILNHVNDRRLEFFFHASTPSQGEFFRIVIASRKNPPQTAAAGDGR